MEISTRKRLQSQVAVMRNAKKAKSMAEQENSQLLSNPAHPVEDYPVENSYTNMPDVASRDASAQEAGRIICQSVSASNTYGTIPASLRSGHISENEQACCGIMSPVRRTFCLMTVFDLILTFILWVIYVEVSRGQVQKDAFRHEVLNYSFSSSLFDTVMCAAWRCIPLLLAYGLWRIQRPWAVAVTTLGTCVFLVTKVFMFDFSVHNNVICYMVLIASFIIAWVETWFLDFKVLPREEKTRERENALHHEERRRLLPGGDGVHHGQDNHEFYSPVESREGSDDESGQGDGFRSIPTSRGHSRNHSHGSLALSLGGEEKSYLEQARRDWDRSWEILHETEGWKLETGKDHDTGLVKFKSFPQIGKLFRLEGYVDAAPQAVFEELVVKSAETHLWNPTVLEGRTLQVIDDNTDISYNVAAEAAGGLVASRDFVNLRHWETRNGIIFSVGSSVTHPDAPACKQHVRGENRAGGGWAFQAIPGNPNKCLYVWIINTDLKGWIPQYVVDQAFSAMLMEFLKHLRKRMAELQAQGDTW